MNIAELYKAKTKAEEVINAELRKLYEASGLPIVDVELHTASHINGHDYYVKIIIKL